MIVMLPMTSTHCIHPTSDNHLLGEYSLPCPFPPKTLPTSSFFLPIQCNIVPKINPKRYFKLMLSLFLQFAGPFCQHVHALLAIPSLPLKVKWQWIGLPTNFQNIPIIFAKLARPRPWSCWLSVKRKWVKKEKRRFTTSIFKTGAESSRPVFATSQWLLSPWPSISKTILFSATIKIKRQNPSPEY